MAINKLTRVQEKFNKLPIYWTLKMDLKGVMAKSLPLGSPIHNAVLSILLVAKAYEPSF